MIGRGTRVATAGVVSYHWIVDRAERVVAPTIGGPVRVLVQTRASGPVVTVPGTRNRSRRDRLTLVPGGRV